MQALKKEDQQNAEQQKTSSSVLHVYHRMQLNKRNANAPYSSGVVSWTNMLLENASLTAVLPTRTKGSGSQTECGSETCCGEKGYIAVGCIKKSVKCTRHEVALLCEILWVSALLRL